MGRKTADGRPRKNKRTTATRRVYAPILPGDRFKSLTTLVDLGVVNSRRRWLVECKCGKRFSIEQQVIRKRKSCGCESSQTFTKITQKRFRLVRELLRENPKFSTCGLARMLSSDYPKLFKSVGDANSVIRQIRGANGNANNKDKEFRR